MRATSVSEIQLNIHPHLNPPLKGEEIWEEGSGILKRNKKGGNYVEIKTILDIIANQGFPIALSILLIFRIDRFMQEIVVAQKEGYRQVLENTKEIHNTITTLNQQNREYYSLRFTEVQKELSGMKVELGSSR